MIVGVLLKWIIIDSIISFTMNINEINAVRSPYRQNQTPHNKKNKKPNSLSNQQQSHSINVENERCSA